MISPKYKYNTRHKIVIGIGIAIMLVLNVLSYKVWIDPKIEVPHRECVELPVDVECTENGQKQVYEVSSSRHYIIRNDEVSTCEEYKEVPRKIDSWNFCWHVLTGVYLIAEFIFILVCMCELIARLIKWVRSDDE